MTHTIESDICIIGGGIAGLWLFRRLNDLGYRALLLENQSLGGGQTIKSQGIIHGGTKYTLSGNLTKASECIAGMPQRWRDCLAGTGELDLSATEILCEYHYMWSPGDIGSRLTSFFASKALRSRVKSVKGEDRPAVFQDPAFKGKLYQLNELVLDIRSLIANMTRGLEARTLKVDWEQNTSLKIGSDQQIEAIELEQNGEQYRIEAKRFVLTAGAGTEDLLQRWGQAEPKMQRRPLHMAMLKTAYPHPLFAHCLGTQMVPRMTITSHPTEDGQWVWYLGGDIAETGVKRSEAEQIAYAQQELGKLLPWVDFSQAQWGTLRVDRAEPKQSSLLRPDAAFCKPVANALVTWPTKLALAPNLSDEVLKSLQAAGIKAPGNEAFALPEELERAPITPAFWHEAFGCN